MYPYSEKTLNLAFVAYKQRLLQRMKELRETTFTDFNEVSEWLDQVEETPGLIFGELPQEVEVITGEAFQPYWDMPTIVVSIHIANPGMTEVETYRSFIQSMSGSSEDN